jgi:hypothetical protein
MLMRARRLLSMVAIFGLVLTACTTGGVVATTRAVYSSTDPNSVKILFSEPHEAYEQIGVVTATGGSVATETQMYRKLQAEARGGTTVQSRGFYSG